MWAFRALNRLSRRRLLRGLSRKMPATGEIVLGAVYSSRFEAQTGGRGAAPRTWKVTTGKGSLAIGSITSRLSTWRLCDFYAVFVRC